MDDSVRAALYARVSSERQAKAMTVASQVEALRKRLAEDGLAADEELCFVDDGYSGSTLQRPALERLRDMAYAGGIDRLYVHSPDRLARKYAYQFLLLEELAKHGVEVRFLNHAADAVTPEQEMLLQMQGMIAEYERAKIMERTRRGRRHAARRGSISVLGHAPYGYRYVSKHEGSGAAAYQVVEDEAQVVRDLFHWVGVEGLSLGEAARRLTKLGVSTRTGKPRWDRTTIHGMLQNPAYKGQAAWGKTRLEPRRQVHRAWRGRPEPPRQEKAAYRTRSEEQEHIPVPALVSDSLFAAVAEQLAENRKRYRTQKEGSQFLLQGLLVCQSCRSAYCGRRNQRHRDRNKRYEYYRCIGNDAYRFGGAAICDNPALSGEPVEEAVWADVCSLLQDPERVRREFERRLERGPEAVVDSTQGERTLSRLKQRIARLIDAYEHGLMDKEDFEPRMRQAKERLAQEQQQYAQQEQAALDRQQLRLIVDEFTAFAQGIAESLNQADRDTQRKLLRLLIKRVDVDRTDIRIVYKVNPLPFVQGPDRGVLQHCGRRRVTPSA